MHPHSLISLQLPHEEATLGLTMQRTHIAKAQYDQTARMHRLIRVHWMQAIYIPIAKRNIDTRINYYIQTINGKIRVRSGDYTRYLFEKKKEKKKRNDSLDMSNKITKFILFHDIHHG